MYGSEKIILCLASELKGLMKIIIPGLLYREKAYFRAKQASPLLLWFSAFLSNFFLTEWFEKDWKRTSFTLIFTSSTLLFYILAVSYYKNKNLPGQLPCSSITMQYVSLSVLSSVTSFCSYTRRSTMICASCYIFLNVPNYL